MPRVNTDQLGWGNHDTIVTGSQGTEQVSKIEWNDSTNQGGLFGFVKQSGTISTNAIVPTGSVIEIQLDGTLNTLTPTNNNEFDLIYLIGKSGEDAITITHNHSGGSGNIRLLGGSSKTLSTTVPLILMARTIGANLEWLEYGGGATVDAGDLTGTTLASGVVTTSATTVGALNSGSITSGFGNIDIGSSDFDTSGTVTCDVTGDVSGSSGSCTGNSATVTTNANLTGGVTSVGNATTVITNANLTGGVTSSGNATTVITNANLTGSVTSVGNASTVVTNANLTGDVTSSGNATTIATSAVDIAMLSATGSAGATTFLCGDNTWKVAGGDDTPWTVVHDFDTYYYDMEIQSKPADPSADNARFYVKEVDTDNDGVFCIIRKNGAFEETQIV